MTSACTEKKTSQRAGSRRRQDVHRARQISLGKRTSSSVITLKAHSQLHALKRVLKVKSIEAALQACLDSCGTDDFEQISPQIHDERNMGFKEIRVWLEEPAASLVASWHPEERRTKVSACILSYSEKVSAEA
ncbi:hypothetical protein L4174_023615 (plasmid) [Photobacterium sp. CCB-ST2H9]|uniref:hypothetical protein n=1 Tax=Photobacterium sp. CCB-ST2H9 TaxID=2912855 RepID=UPI002004AED7|nr:hypothetical protein [Photobacterium sp. CCB-ST2H9]UTM60457.1 hypothetical protein L4174_023615 [Photobacterium sp. CCB-ST2H9]